MVEKRKLGSVSHMRRRLAGYENIEVKDVAVYCMVSTSTVRRWLKDGKLKAIRLPSNQYRIRTTDFVDFLRDYDIPIEEEFFQGWCSRSFTVPPGLTGLWQVFGRGRVSHSEAAAMYVYYTYCRSFRLDLYLILRTLGIILSAQGAA